MTAGHAATTADHPASTRFSAARLHGKIIHGGRTDPDPPAAPRATPS